MSRAVRKHIISQVITSAGNSGALDNLSALGETPAQCSLVVNVTAVGGTTPSVTINLDVSPNEGTDWVTVASTSSLTAVGLSRLTRTDIIEGKVRLSWGNPGGSASPSLTVTAYLIFN